MNRTETGSDQPRKGWLDYIDTAARLAAAAAVVFAATIASRYESRMTSISLLNQREQSESALRASMFQNLIDPIVGHPPTGKPIPADRERLLAELLTLNFHDHFEFKPLLLEVDTRLIQNGLEPDRNLLASTARRVIDRQINLLNVAQANYDGEELAVASFSYVQPPYQSPSSAPPPSTGAPAAAGPSGGQPPWTFVSPDHRWEVVIDVLAVDFTQRTVKLSFNAKRTVDHPDFRGMDFELTQFDFPLTDYTQLDSKHRLALSLFDVDTNNRALLMKLIWFPPGYITERERPFDYRSIREALKLD